MARKKVEAMKSKVELDKLSYKQYQLCHDKNEAFSPKLYKNYKLL